MEQVSNLLGLSHIQHGFYSALDYQTVSRPILMTQVHSADVLIIKEYTNLNPAVDALVTKTRGLTLTVKTADCCPVLLADNEHKVIAAVHAGWKGAFQGIIENAVLAMLSQGAQIENITAGLGPCLHQPHFEIGAQMHALFPVTEHGFFMEKNGSVYFDFVSYVMHRLHRVGVQSVECVDQDTYSSPDYFSYRRDPKNPGRQYSCISLK